MQLSTFDECTQCTRTKETKYNNVERKKTVINKFNKRVREAARKYRLSHFVERGYRVWSRFILSGIKSVLSALLSYCIWLDASHVFFLLFQLLLLHITWICVHAYKSSKIFSLSPKGSRLTTLKWQHNWLLGFQYNITI